MTSPTEAPALARFQSLLRELFQFDSADLDFGIYRILNARRGLFEDWINTRLPADVRKALSSGAVAQADVQAQHLAELAAKLREEQEDDAIIDGDGRLRDGITGRTAREYRELWQVQQASAQPADADARAADIYNRLYDFFRRYYEDGDFLSLRRYGADDAYAVPYNGQEVMLHWANRDQYYVKTGEHFTDYRFRAGDKADAWHVEFKLQQAQTDRDNTKASEKRHFFFDIDATTVDAEGRTLTVPVAWRAPTAAEAGTLPSRNAQDAINTEAERKLSGRRALKAQPALLAALKANVAEAGAEPQSLLARHLRRYTRRNTSDFFIHKDLRGFLNRELDYWLKAEVLKLDTLLAGGEQPAQAWLQTLACLREIATTIIDFVARIEDFQKRLYEKRKFITESHWCLTLDHVERAGLTNELVKLLNDTAGGKAQKAEWKALYAIDEVKAADGKPGWKDKVTAEFLRSQPYLVLDTVHFPHDFTDALLASIDGLDAVTGGLLVHGDNWQALNLLMERYREQVQCVYIDPPYNTGPSEIIYRNEYKHSSWLSLMQNRLALSSSMVDADAPTIVAIDENERDRLGILLETLHSGDVACISIVHNPRGIQGKGFSYTHEFAYFMMPTGYEVADRSLEQSKEKPLMKTGSNSLRETGNANMFYPVYVKSGKITRVGDPAKESFHPGMKQKTTSDDEVEVWPIDSEGKERKWRYKQQSIKARLKQLSARPGRDGRQSVYLAKDAESYRTVWADSRYNAAEYGSTLIKNMLPNSEFTFPKSVYTVIDCLSAANFDVSSTVIDYFAGSGTTAHAVVTLNRGDDGERKYVLCEMGNYFDTVLRPRLSKAIYSSEWKNGKPVTRDGMSHAFKYFRFESYEDTLSNLRLRADAPGQGEIDLDTLPDVYRLGYWLDAETAGSASLLDVDKLEQPFDYALTVHDGKAARTQTVDLAETFNYLIGLIVRRRRVLDRDGHRYLLYLGRTRADDADTAVLWRDIRGWTQDDFAAERDWIAAQAPFGGATVIYVNGDSAIPGAQSLDPVFHARMFAPVH